MPTCYQYLIVWPNDPRDEIEALEAKGNSLGLGEVKAVREIARTKMKRFKHRNFGGRLYVDLKAKDTIIFPSFSRAFRTGDFLAMLAKWVAADVRVIVIDLGLDTASEFGRLWCAVTLNMRLQDRRASQLSVERRPNRKRGTSNAGRRLFGTVTKGPKGSRRMYVDPVMYEVGMKARQWLADGWTYDDIETHLWKNKVYRSMKYGPSESARTSDYLYKWTACSIRTLVRNLDEIDKGVLDGRIGLKKGWRPTTGPLSEIPVEVNKRGSALAPQRHWDEAKAIGAKVKSILDERGWNQKMLVKATGMPQPMISELLRGIHHPRSTTLAAVAKALDVPLSTFNLVPAAPI